MTHFTKEKVRDSCKLNIFTCKVVKSPWCFCNMICCENRKCKTWFRLGFGSKWVAVSVLWTTESVSSGRLFQIEFCQTIRCWLLNSLFSPNELRHILFKFLIPNILDVMPSLFFFNFLIPNILNAIPSKENANQNVSPASEPGIFITRNGQENYINSICF